jgi:hypothetical protein
VDLPKDNVLLVSAHTLPQSLNNAPVVLKESEMLVRFTSCEESIDQEFETNCFGPTDISAFGLPSHDEPPGSLTACNDDGDADSRAGI